MPIDYEVYNSGHLIIAYAKGHVTAQEIIQYEIDHSIDERIKGPLNELFIVESDALLNIGRDDVNCVLKIRSKIDRKTTPHRCAIVLRSGDVHSWNLAKYYEGMVELHLPENVIVFGDEAIARTWLGIEKIIS